MKNDKVKAKNMTRLDAIPVLEKIAKKGNFGKRKNRALQIAIDELRHKTWNRNPQNPNRKSSPRALRRSKLSTLIGKAS